MGEIGKAEVERLRKPTCCFDLWARVEELEQALRSVSQLRPEEDCVASGYQHAPCENCLGCYVRRIVDERRAA
jgi:hypothetical protein